MICLEFLAIGLIVVYIIDLSGFTSSLLRLLSVMWRRKVTSLKPLTCSQCMTWWACLIYALCTGRLCVWTVALAALTAFLTMPIGSAMIFIKETLLRWIDGAGQHKDLI